MKYIIGHVCVSKRWMYFFNVESFATNVMQHNNEAVYALTKTGIYYEVNRVGHNEVSQLKGI